MVAKVPYSMLGADVSSTLLPSGVGPMPYIGSTPPSGWILADGRTIGSASSGASSRANADCQGLFEVLWSSLSDTEAPVIGGRGASAAADWAANKPITLPDMRGRVAAGKDDMGGTAAGRLNVTLTGTRASVSTGVITGLSSTSALTVGMRAIGTGIATGAVISSIDSGTQVTLSANSLSTGSGSIRFGVVDGATLGAAGGSHTHALATAQIPSHDHGNGATVLVGATVGSSAYVGSVSSKTGATGGGQSHPILQPSLVVNYILKL